jgi:hypothetical protein
MPAYPARFYARRAPDSHKQYNEPGRFRTRALFSAVAVLVIAVVVIWWPGCHKYPAATSRESYVLMKALYTACNTKNVDSLSKIERWVDQAAREGKLGPAEQDAFAGIIGMAKNGQWQEATKETYRFSEDQVGRGKLFPKS